VEAHEIAERIHEEPETEAHAEPSHDRFRRITAVYVGIVAMLLAIAALGGSEAGKEMLNANIHASDTYAFYQAKYIRQTGYEIAAEEIELLAAGSPGLPQAQLDKTQQLVKRYRDTAARYESEPATGNGKKELLAKAKEWRSGATTRRRRPPISNMPRRCSRSRSSWARSPSSRPRRRWSASAGRWRSAASC
jgi:Domain of unknown function (DUF4337)